MSGKRGRPGLPDWRRRENILRIRLTDDERVAINCTAGLYHTTTSEWVRQKLLLDSDVAEFLYGGAVSES